MDMPMTSGIFPPTLQRSVYHQLALAVLYLLPGVLSSRLFSFTPIRFSLLQTSTDINRNITNPGRTTYLLQFNWRIMKFGKSLSNQIEEALPEWRDKFLSYKELKKQLKLIESKGGDASRPFKRARLDSDDGADSAEYVMTKEEIDFIKLLEDELEKFNTFFVEKEEEYIIRLKELQDRVVESKDSDEEIINIRKEIVDFHGEMVLLENYSALNYTGLVKILKKYDKRTGALIRLPFIQKVLQQPFFTTDLLYKLVKECEAMLDRLFPMKQPPSAVDAGDGDNGLDGFDPSTSSTTRTEGCLRVPDELAEIENVESSYMKSTIAALRVLKEIRSGSSTVSVFSLPPLQISGLEGDWKKVPILEQVAK